MIKVGDNGSVFYADGIVEKSIDKELFELLKSQYKEKISFKDARSKIEKRIAKAIKNKESNPIELQLAQKEQNQINILEKEREKAFKEKLQTLSTPSSHLADKVDDVMLSPFLSFLSQMVNRYHMLKHQYIIFDNEKLFSLGDEWIEKAKEDMDAFKQFLDTHGIQWENDNTTEILQTELNNNVIIILGENGDGINTLLTIPNNKLEDKLNDDIFINKLKFFSKITSYQMNKDDFLENQSLFDENNITQSIESISSCTKIFQSHQPIIDVKEQFNFAEIHSSKWAKEQMEYLMTLYKPSCRYNPKDIDFSPLEKLGFDFKVLPQTECIDILNGNLSHLINSVSEQNKSLSYKLHLTKSENDKIKFVIHPKQNSVNIPNQILGIELSEKQQQQLNEKGILDNALVIQKEDGKSIYAMPYVDKDTNQILIRNLNSVSLDVPIENYYLNPSEKEKLRQGGLVRLKELVDNGGQLYTGYAHINPLDGTIMVVKKSDLKYAYQVAANNHGARTEDLKHDADTFLKSGQIYNDDLKPNRTHTIRN